MQREMNTQEEYFGSEFHMDTNSCILLSTSDINLNRDPHCSLISQVFIQSKNICVCLPNKKLEVLHYLV